MSAHAAPHVFLIRDKTPDPQEDVVFQTNPIPLDPSTGIARLTCSVPRDTHERLRFSVIRADGSEAQQFMTVENGTGLGVLGGPQVVVDGGDRKPEHH